MKSKKQITDWIIKNCIDVYGKIDLSGLDFSNLTNYDANGDVDISEMKVKRDLFSANQEVGRDLFLHQQKVGRDLYQSYQKVEGNLYQSYQKVEGNLYQYEKKEKQNEDKKEQCILCLTKWEATIENDAYDFRDGEEKLIGKICGDCSWSVSEIRKNELFRGNTPKGKHFHTPICRCWDKYKGSK